MNEIWKTIKDYEDYEVSNMGNVRRLFPKGYHYLKQIQQRDGYMRVKLCKNGQPKRFSVHRLVAQAFLDNPLNLPQVNHKNHIRTDNRVDNLEWCDNKYNTRYSLAKPIVGFNDKMVIAFEAIRDVELIGLHFQNVSRCLSGRYKQAYGLQWKYITREEYDRLKTDPKVKTYGNFGQYTN